MYFAIANKCYIFQVPKKYFFKKIARNDLLFLFENKPYNMSSHKMNFTNWNKIFQIKKGVLMKGEMRIRSFTVSKICF